MRELSLANVAAEVTAWRKTKQHRTSILPKEIADHIRELAKSHKRPNRPYGGYLCSSCARKHFKNEARK